MDVPHLTEDEMAEIKKDPALFGVKGPLKEEVPHLLCAHINAQPSVEFVAFPRPLLFRGPDSSLRLPFASPARLLSQVLTRLRHYLCDRIRAERHLDYLRSRRILTRDDAEEIGCRTTQTKRTAMLLDILAENPRGLDALIDSIRELRAQNFIITKITDEVQKAKNEKMESLRAGASSSSSDSSLSAPSTTSDLLTTFSNNSTLLFHPDGERSPSTSDVAGSLNLPSLQKGGDLEPSGAGASIGVASSTTSSSLPRPGDPGAPPLPEEVMVEAPSNIDAGAPGCTSGGDPNFQPLRSRSLTPTLHRSVF